MVTNLSKLLEKLKKNILQRKEVREVIEKPVAEKKKEPKAFEEILKFTLIREGYISDDKDDPGKLTIWGIASKYNPKEVAAMKKLIEQGKKEEAFIICKDTYWKKYWLRAGCEQLDFKMACVAFEYAVNPGIGALNKALSENPTDWRDLLLKRIKYFSDKNNKKYIRGWVRRSIDLYTLLIRKK